MRDTIDMAREAGGCEYGNANPDIESTFILKDDQIKAFEALVRADEREACADIAENWNCNGSPRLGVAAQIRARGQA
jgi:hypothetical protein